MTTKRKRTQRRVTSTPKPYPPQQATNETAQTRKMWLFVVAVMAVIVGGWIALLCVTGFGSNHEDTLFHTLYEQVRGAFTSDTPAVQTPEKEQNQEALQELRMQVFPEFEENINTSPSE